MIDDLSTEETTVIATYWRRLDAEMAQRRLEGENIRSFITADDAGGIHTDFQLIHGVKLVALSHEASAARSILEDTQMLPATSAEEEGGAAADRVGLQRRSSRTLFMLGAGIVILGFFSRIIAGPTVGAVLIGLGGAVGLAGGIARWRGNEGNGSPTST